MKLACIICAGLLLPSFCLGQEVINLELGSKAQEANERAAAKTAQKHGAYRLHVRYVRIEGRWKDQVALPLAAGDLLTPEKLSEAMAALKAAMTSRMALNLGLRSKGEIGVLWIDVEFDTSYSKPSDKNTAGVIFHPYLVDISLVQVGDNVLPIPRSPWPVLPTLPAPLRALHPSLALSYDRAFGTAISLGIDATSAKDALEVRAEGTHALEKKFYRANAQLGYNMRRTGSYLEELALTAGYDGTKEPLGGDEHTRDAFNSSLGIKLKIAPNTRLFLDGGYRYSRDSSLDTITSLRKTESSNVGTGRLLFESIPPYLGGFVRGAFWEEAAWQRHGDTYQRFVARVGYEKEIPLAQNQTIGLEVLAGAGHASGSVPSFATFFGGNLPGQFLYDRTEASSLTRMPSGPILRSFGENEAGLREVNGIRLGGDTFWHVNLNVTLPIPALSRSLIPNEPAGLEDSQGRPLSIKQVLTNQIDVTGLSFLVPVLMQEGLSEEQATRKAHKILDEVSPAARFIINQANLYSLKPLLMFDAAGLSDGRTSQTWLAAGGGLQLTIVTAKLEAGYMHTVSGPTFGHDGNAFVRLVFQNLF